MGEAERQHRRGVALIAASALVWSFAGVFMRLAPPDLWVVQFWRAASGAAALYLFMLWRERSGVLAAMRLSARGWAAMVVSAAAMVTYIAALHLTSVAEVMIVAATMPMVTAAIAWAALGERPTPRVLATSLVALLGIVVMVGGAPAFDNLVGDAVALAMTALFALLIVVARHDHAIDMTVVNAHSATLVALLSIPLAGGRLLDVSAGDLALLALFGATTTALAFALFLYGARRVPPAESALILLLDNSLSPVWVWLAFAERPGPAALAGGAIVFLAVLSHLAADLLAARPRAAAAPMQGRK
ncbi:MAG: DMT family transporter [Methylobacteriaceae bacterium]|nr:DMT family transporter [Methylobacteriaceae bacterium]